MQDIWIITSDENDTPYRSTGFLTRAEARYRLREMADEPFYVGLGEYTARSAVRQSDDMFVTPDGVTFRVIKWCTIQTAR